MFQIRHSVRDWLQTTAFDCEPMFKKAAILIALIGAVFCSLSLFDTRTIFDDNVWIKPIKFSAALSVYLLTLAYYARWLPESLRHNRVYRGYSWVVVAAVFAELAWIGGAAAFGTTSHFNGETAFMAALYPIMGILAVLLTTPTLFYGGQIAVNRPSNLSPALIVALSGGLILTFVSTVLVAGYLSSVGGHYVGIPPSDLKLPIMGWSREVGDLRVAHFFATHAMHVVPLLAIICQVTLKRRMAMVATALSLCLYAGLITLTFIQARAGLPFL